MKKIILFLIVVSTIIALTNISFAQDVTEKKSPPKSVKVVKAIDVVGNKTISMATILSRVKTRVGQNYLQSVISDDLKRLYNTGYFSDVRVDFKDFEGGVKVFFYLDEKPIIEEVTFSKTKYIKTRTIKNKIQTQVGKFLDNKVLKEDENLIKDLYSKKGLTKVEVEVEKFVDEVTNKASLHFIIREGYKVRVKKITVMGNYSFKKGKILGLIKTKKKGLFNSGYFREELLSEDMERIVSFYEKEGYIDAKATNTVEQLYKGFVNIDITIEEGKRYYVGKVTLAGNKIISDKEILNVMTEIKERNIFSREKLAVDISNIRTLYFDRGYIFADITDSISSDPETGRVEIKLDIYEGKLAYVDKIKIQGNTRTRDIVIRRELKMYPGDRFDGTKLRRSKERLNNLGYFEDVNFDVEDTDYYDRKDLVVQVKEAKTGTFSFGGGFSTVDKLVGFVEIEQRNFDFTNWPSFTGGGQHLSLRAETGSTKNNLMLSFTEPWLFDYPISAGFDAFRSQRDKEEDTGYAYDEKIVGGKLRLGKQFNDLVSGGISYGFKKITIENFDAGVSADLLDEEGTNKVSTLGFSLSRDTRDNVFSPRKGLYVTGSVDIAGGPLGGDKDFYRTQAQASYYMPMKFKSVLQFSVKGGIINNYGDSDKVPIFERFFAGGARSIRGYNERNVGPHDSNTDDPIGGESTLVANIEYVIPVIDFVKLAAFFDTGNVWADMGDIGTGGFKSGFGVGARIKTPIGPINLDYGYPLNDEVGEDTRTGKFYFSVSRGF